MYSVSAAYSEAIAKQSRHFRLSGDILLQSRTKIDITDRNILGDMNIESVMMSGSSSEDIIDIGAVVSSKLTMKIHDSNTSDSFADAMVRPIVGLETSADVYEDIPMGIFYVNAASIKRVKDQISFAAYDKMIFMQYILTEDMRSAISVMKPYGATAYLAAFVGIPMAQEQAVVDAFPNGDIILSGATDKRIETARDLIMWCAQMMGCYVRINRSGRLEYVQIKAEISADTGMIIPVREIAASQRNDTKFADGVLRISSLIMKKADGTPTRAYLAETSSTKRSVELELEQNPLLIGEKTRTVGEALKAILTVLKTAYFRPFSASIANDPALDAGDYVRLRGGNIDTTRGYATGMITHNSWHYSGNHDIVNVGAVPVISQLEDTAAAAEVAEVSEVAEGEECEDISGNEIVYAQPRKQSEKLAACVSGSSGGGSISLGALDTYTYLTDSSIEYNGLTYTIEKDDTGLITRITDDDLGEFEPKNSGNITDVAFHNAVLTAVAMLCGLPKPQLDDPLTAMVQYRYNLDSYTADGTTINWLNQASGIATPFVLTGATLADGGVNLMGTSTSRGTMAYAGSATEYTIYLVANANGGMRVLETSGTGNYNTAACLWGNTGYWQCTACVSGTEISSAVSSLTKTIIAIVKLADGTYRLYINGERVGTQIDGKDLAAGNICLTYSTKWGSSAGNFFYYDFALAESAHNETDIITNSKYLMTKYNIK